MSDKDITVTSSQAMTQFVAPDLPYRPPVPQTPTPPIGLVGCGAITEHHLDAYKKAGFEVVAFCDINEKNAQKRRDTYNPEGTVYTKYSDLLKDPRVKVVDVATHVDIRGSIVEAALRAGKHVLSQKPFVIDLDEGERLANLAEERGLKLAVNQNGRWAPHFSYMRKAIAAGCIGQVQGAHLAVHWDHTWTEDTVFNDIHHLILYDFAIHWFDIVTCFMGKACPVRCYASLARTATQTNKPPMLAQVLVEYENAQATLVFDAITRHGSLDHTQVNGTLGTLSSFGADISSQEVTLHTAAGIAQPRLEGEWFMEGFIGTMAELLCAIQEDRAPENNAHDNLKSLSLCFAALESTHTKMPQIPGAIRRMPQ